MQNSEKHILYLSYDGLTDPLGSSQVLPYIEKLSDYGYRFTVMSFEKPSLFESGRAEISRRISSRKIKWIPLRYHKSPPIFSTLYDLFVLFRESRKLNQSDPIHMIHCRSYLTSLIGLSFKKKLGTHFLFDMRGLWADERVDGHLWPQSNWVYRAIYRYFKNKEKDFLLNADHVVVLTETIRKEILNWNFLSQNPPEISVIPCCVDTDHFSMEKIAAFDPKKIKEEFQIQSDETVFTYLGSLGTWYLVDEMLDFFATALKTMPRARFLFITRDSKTEIFESARKRNIPLDRFAITSSPYSDIPRLLSITDFGICFILPSYSKMASSPTKLAEFLALGIPVIANPGVGDTEKLFLDHEIGGLVKEMNEESFQDVIHHLAKMKKIPKEKIRKVATHHFSLDGGGRSYRKIYQKILSDSIPLLSNPTKPEYQVAP